MGLSFKLDIAFVTDLVQAEDEIKGFGLPGLFSSSKELTSPLPGGLVRLLPPLCRVAMGASVT